MFNRLFAWFSSFREPIEGPPSWSEGAGVPAPQLTIRCALCGAACTAEDYCFGCHSPICSQCDNPIADARPQGSAHKPEAHRVAAGATR